MLVLTLLVQLLVVAHSRAVQVKGSELSCEIEIINMETAEFKMELIDMLIATPSITNPNQLKSK